MMAYTVEDPNHDPNLYSEIDVSSCTAMTSIEEHFKNKELIKITDLLGREAKASKNEPLFYIYDDGTVEKKLIIE